MLTSDLLEKRFDFLPTCNTTEYNFCRVQGSKVISFTSYETSYSQLKQRSQFITKYKYASGNPINHADPFGLFDIQVNESGSRDGGTYDATITVTGENGETVTVQGSSYSNPESFYQANPNNTPVEGVSEGTYPGTYSETGHRGSQEGVRINNGGAVPTTEANPSHGGQSLATGINIHCGASATNRGSRGCIAISPEQCDAAFSVLGEGETGTITINRSQQ